MRYLAGFYRWFGPSGLIAFTLLLVGVQMLFVALMSRGELTMTCAQFLAEKPGGGWLTLTDCVVSRIQTVSTSGFGEPVTEVFLPVRSTDDATDHGIRVLLASTAKEDVNFLTGADAQKFKHFRNTVKSKLEETRSISGKVRRGLDLDDHVRNKLLKTLPTLSRDFTVIEERPKPGFTPVFSILFLGISIAAFRFRREFVYLKPLVRDLRRRVA